MARDPQTRNRAGRKTRRWLVLAAAASLAAIQGQQKPMDGLAIATFPVRAAAISGESLPFRTILENRGTPPVEIPAQSTQSQFTYTLVQQREGGRTMVVSVADRNRRRSPHIPPNAPIRYETLPPGRSVERIEDLADFVNEGFEPGEYLVTARYDEAGVSSPKAPVTILPDNVESFSSAVSGGVLASAMAHRRTDGGVTILQRESLKDPREGVFYQRQTLPAGDPASVAISIDVVPAGSGRWCAWLRDRTLTAAVGWGDRTIVTTQPAQLDAPQPELLGLGFQIGPGAGLFGVLDRRGNEARLLAYLADKSGLKLHWVASLTSGGAGEVHWNCQSDGSVTVVWQEPATGRLLSREFTAAGQPRDSAPRVRTSSRPAAWSVLPSGPLAISVLGVFGGSFRYARLGAESVADPNPIAELPGVTGWGFIPSANGVRIVAATAAGISQIAPGGAWQTVVKTENPQRVNVFTAPDGSPWVEWVQPGYGIRRLRLV